MNIKTPQSWRKGQTVFNFLWWLKEQKGYATEMMLDLQYLPGRMADPFHIPDAEFDRLWEEFIAFHTHE